MTRNFQSLFFYSLPKNHAVPVRDSTVDMVSQIEILIHGLCVSGPGVGWHIGSYVRCFALIRAMYIFRLCVINTLYDIKSHPWRVGCRHRHPIASKSGVGGSRDVIRHFRWLTSSSILYKSVNLVWSAELTYKSANDLTTCSLLLLVFTHTQSLTKAAPV